MTYAAKTDVSTGRSREEIERTLSRYGATSFAYGWNGDGAAVTFVASGRAVRFHLPLPDRRATEFTHTPGRGLARTKAQAESSWEQACRQKWRALALAIKAKLEAVEADITTFENEFLAHIVLPNNTTVGEWAGPALDQAYSTGTMPSLMPGLS